jgi:hypothetical protein
MKKIYKVTLPHEERLELTQLVSKGKSNAKNIKHANILLAVDETENGRVSDQEVAKQFHCHGGRAEAHLISSRQFLSARRTMQVDAPTAGKTAHCIILTKR